MTTTTDLAAAVARLDRAIAAGDVIRGQWTSTEDGRARACLLAALVPACGVEKTATACPAEVLPPWLAECVPWIDDAGTEGAWPEMIRDFAALLCDSASAPAELWPRLNLHWRSVAIAEAMAHTSNPTVLRICAEVAAMLDAALAGESIDPEAWEDARTAAGAARAGAAVTWAGAACPRASAAAGLAATWGDGAGATSAATWAATAAARRMLGAAAGAELAARSAASDRITAEFFAAWRAELDAQTTEGDQP